MPDVISVTPNRKFAAHTARSWDFLRLDDNSQSSTLLQKGNYGEDIIIGIIDSGIWPESKSFDAAGFGPAPKRWRGICQTGDLFGASNCSNKIIGARWYDSDLSASDLKGEYRSPRDYAGHGTHTASTAAGNVVSKTSFHGLAAGSVRGGAPRARLAIYKACWGQNVWCSGASAPMERVWHMDLCFPAQSPFRVALAPNASTLRVVAGSCSNGPCWED